MALRAEDIYPILKKYTDDSIAGTSGALSGKNCQIQSIDPIDGGNRITFVWYEDGSSIARTDYLDVIDGEKGDTGEQGEPGEKGDTGFSPIITVESQTANTYILRIKTADDEFLTPNLKGSGGSGGIDVSVSEESLIFTYNS